MEDASLLPPMAKKKRSKLIFASLGLNTNPWKWWELLYTWAGWIYHQHPPGGDQDALMLSTFTGQILAELPVCSGKICQHLGQMSNVGFSTQSCRCVNDHSSLSEVFVPSDWQLCVNRWRWQGGCNALVWTSRLGSCLYNWFKKLLSVIWLWLYDMTV